MKPERPLLRTNITSEFSATSGDGSFKLRSVESSYLLVQGLRKGITAQRCRSATEKFILEDLFSSVSQQFKISPLWKLEV